MPAKMHAADLSPEAQSMTKRLALLQAKQEMLSNALSLCKSADHAEKAGVTGLIEETAAEIAGLSQKLGKNMGRDFCKLWKDAVDHTAQW